MGRRGGYIETQTHGDVGQAVPHPPVVDKSLEGYFRSEGSQPHIRLLSPWFQRQEDKSPYFLTVKTSGGWGGRRDCRILRSLLLKGPPTVDLGLTQTHSF